MTVSDGACPCCVSTALFLTLAAGFVVINVVQRVVERLVPSASLLGKACRLTAILSHALVVVVAIGLGALNASPSLRSFVFYKFAMRVLAGDNAAVDSPRCELVSRLSGRVLEIGPGPGTNFRCWSNNSDIVEWVGVEPNTFFDEHLQREKQLRNVSFPISTIWLNGEDDIDVEPQSFDFVVGTHVLCSVSDVYKVLAQVRRALKPGGEYVFLEHVVADREKDFGTYLGQLLIQPEQTDSSRSLCDRRAIINLHPTPMHAINHIPSSSDLQRYSASGVHLRFLLSLFPYFFVSMYVCVCTAKYHNFLHRASHHTIRCG